MFQGLRTVVYGVKDLEEAKKWYSNILNIQPYFDQPFYVGFSIGGFELGLDPGSTPGTSGPTSYWGVEDAKETYTRLLAAGARESEAIHDVGDGILLGTVTDPFGNTLGVIQNPHFSLSEREE